jgi:phage shock protein PspC (stress-responsive transcriptional regulator)
MSERKISMENKKLKRSVNNRAVAGVCGGIAEFFDLSPTLMRVLFILIPGPQMFVIYLILANVLPEEHKYLF